MAPVEVPSLPLEEKYEETNVKIETGTAADEEVKTEEVKAQDAGEAENEGEEVKGELTLVEKLVIGEAMGKIAIKENKCEVELPEATANTKKVVDTSESKAEAEVAAIEKEDELV